MQKICTKCLILKPLKDFYSCKAAKDRRTTRCGVCMKAYSKKWAKENPEKKTAFLKKWKQEHKQEVYEYNLQYMPKYYQANKEKLIAQSVEYKKQKSKTDINFRIARNLRRRLNHVVKGTAKSAPTIELLGCTIADLKSKMQIKFYNNPETGEAMTWDNYGKNGWHLDHIIPLANFKQLFLADEQKKAFHFSNLQPLWSKDNLKKNKYISEEKIRSAG